MNLIKHDDIIIKERLSKNIMIQLLKLNDLNNVHFQMATFKIQINSDYLQNLMIQIMHMALLQI